MWLLFLLLPLIVIAWVGPVKTLQAIQLLVIFLLGVSFAADGLGMSILASLVFGGLPAQITFFALQGAFPRPMLYGATAFFALGSVQLAHWMGGTAETVVAAALVGGFLGFSANKRLLEEAGVQLPFSEEDAIEMLEPRFSDIDVFLTSHALGHLLRARAIKTGTYCRAIQHFPPGYHDPSPEDLDIKRLDRDEPSPRSLEYVDGLQEYECLTAREAKEARYVIGRRLKRLSGEKKRADYERALEREKDRRLDVESYVQFMEQRAVA